MDFQKASGATDLFKEDGVSDKLLMQLKTTENKTTRLSRQTFKDLIFNARKYHKKPFAVIRFLDDFDWIMVRPFDMLEIAQELEKINSKRDYIDYEELLKKLLYEISISDHIGDVMNGVIYLDILEKLGVDRSFESRHELCEIVKEEFDL